jgi:hypothetical protein
MMKKKKKRLGYVMSDVEDISVSSSGGCSLLGKSCEFLSIVTLPIIIPFFIPPLPLYTLFSLVRFCLLWSS